MFGGACGMVGGRATVGLDVDPLARVEGPNAECVAEVGFVAALSLLNVFSIRCFGNNILYTLISQPGRVMRSKVDRQFRENGRGYYGQAKAGRAAKATHGTQVTS